VDVVVLGGHGKIGLRLLRLLAERGDRARGLVRKREQVADLEAVGAAGVLVDVEREDEITKDVAGADAVVFAAGAGPGSGPERKRTVDYGGAVKLIEAARGAGISRYLIVSAMGASDPSRASGQMRAYYEAKSEADAALADSGLDYTIVRPGRLTDDPGTGLIEVADMKRGGAGVPRDDVAAVLLETLGADNTIGKAFDLLSGETPIAEAIAALA
jgi:uncharacterized protein YbjT (DUF2867 family)